MSYLSTDLVTAIKRRAAVPTAQTTFSNTDFFALLDEEIRSKLVPLVTKNIEEYWVRTYDHNLTANQASYLIPTRAVAAGLRDVQIVNSANQESRVPLERLAPEDLYTSFTGNHNVAVQKNGFYLQNNSVVVYPTPTSTQNLLRLSYVCRPNQVVDTTACGLISAIDTLTNTITLTSLPSTFSTASPLDFVKANPHFECAAIDQTPTSVVGTALTFASTLPTDLAVGDYVCLAGQSCVVQVPVELQPLLVQYVVVRVLSAQADAAALHDAIAELKKLEDNAMLLIAPRVAGKSKRVVNSRAINRFV